MRTKLEIPNVRRWNRVLVIALALVAAMAICVLNLFRSKSLPPPRVALTFLQYTNFNNGTFAIMSFANKGQIDVSLWDSIELWEANVETTAGWITNSAPFESVGGERIHPGTIRLFAVRLPSDTIKWRVTTTFGYQKRPHFASKFHNMIWRSWLVQRSPDAVADAISWILDLLPAAPRPSHGTISTRYFTNRPPSAAFAPDMTFSVGSPDFQKVH